MIRTRVVALALAMGADRLLGEPPATLHPVARFGQAMAALEQQMWSDRRQSGALFAVAGIGAAASAGAVLSPRRPWGGVVALAGATYVAVAGRALGEAAMAVDAALRAGDLPEARRLLRSLVGRRPDDLEPAEIVRATVESVAENTVDAVVAPLLWALAAGVPGVLAYRAANTLDAMVGHRSARYERFGWAAARIDDAANWLPARVTAVAVAARRPASAAAVARAVRHQAPAHPSPNAGVAEAAFAAALGVALGGVNDYAGRAERRPALGTGRAPDVDDIAEACRLSRQVAFGVAAASALAAVAVACFGDRR